MSEPAPATARPARARRAICRVGCRRALRTSRTALRHPLELFFDLVFVVAIAQAAGGLHHAIAEAPRARRPHRLPDGLLCHLVGVDELHLVRLGV